MRKDYLLGYDDVKQQTHIYSLQARRNISRYSETQIIKGNRHNRATLRQKDDLLTSLHLKEYTAQLSNNLAKKTRWSNPTNFNNSNTSWLSQSI